MERHVKLKLAGILSVFLLMSAFVVLSYFVQGNIEFFEVLVSDNYWGLIVFVLLNFVGIIVAPVTVIPLIVIVTSIWGGLVAAFATLVAWVLGSVVAFLLARKIGVPIVSRFISMDELYRFEERFGFVGSFWGVVFLRMVVPVEILSYGLGLGSRIGFWKYTLASVLGLMPVCLIFGYLGMIPIIYQIVLGLILLNGILAGMIWRELR
ncbi:TVP38/TMEM64 family protein [Methanococcoides sp. SA1]|nr:TVP38/TMEM64 family protein [Methanococcoides sp. SA1]